MHNDYLYRAGFLIGEIASWQTWNYQGTGTERQVPNLGAVTVVEIKADTRSREDSAYYDNYAQGSTDELHIVFKVEFDDGEVRHFQKIGESDSYGSEEWHGPFIEVQPVEKTVYAYERA